MAYDVLLDRRPGRAAKEYLRSSTWRRRKERAVVDEALRLLLERASRPTPRRSTRPPPGRRPAAMTEV